MTFLYNVLKEVLIYAKRPIETIEHQESTFKKLKFVIALLLLQLCASIAIVLFTKSIGSSIGIDKQNLLQDNLSQTLTFFWRLLFMGLVAPIIEEIIFRLSIRLKHSYLALSIAVLVAHLSSRTFFDSSFFDIRDQFIEKALTTSIAFTLLYFLLSPFKDKISQFGKDHFQYVFYFFVVGFGFIHIRNYNFTLINLLFIWLITMPQIIAGFTMGYIRVKYGILWSIFLHCVNNSIASVFLYFFKL
jgi:membrane protease YdiL (CAAX protease family)